MAKMPTTILTATPEQLVERINQEYAQINAFTAPVTFKVSEGGSLKGREKTYTSFSGYILLRKPEDIRVIGFLPFVHTQAFDMGSNGKRFTVVIPPKNKAYSGPNTVAHESHNPLENLRPEFFFDSLLINSIGHDDLLTLTAETKTQINPQTKRLEIQPGYDLTVLHRTGDSNVLVPRRVVHFNRTDLEPYEEDIYDAHGDIETQAIFGPLRSFGAMQYPSSVTIRRPLQEYEIVVTFQKITFNLGLTDDQFDVKIPVGMPVTQLH
jgi:hypothetical protein